MQFSLALRTNLTNEIDNDGAEEFKDKMRIVKLVMVLRVEN